MNWIKRLIIWLSGGKGYGKGSRYYIHGLIGPDSTFEFVYGSRVDLERGHELAPDAADDQLARRRIESSEFTEASYGRPNRRVTATEVTILADDRLRHGRYDHPPTGPFCGIDELREGPDTDRAATRAGQACVVGVDNAADEPDRTVRSILQRDAATGGLRVVRHDDNRDEG